jgi:hypothetical protein
MSNIFNSGCSFTDSAIYIGNKVPSNRDNVFFYVTQANTRFLSTGPYSVNNLYLTNIAELQLQHSIFKVNDLHMSSVHLYIYGASLTAEAAYLSCK